VSSDIFGCRRDQIERNLNSPALQRSRRDPTAGVSFGERRRGVAEALSNKTTGMLKCLVVSIGLLWSSGATADCIKLSEVIWARVPPGAVINVCPGETTSISVTGRGTAASPIVIQAAPGSQPSFVGSLVLYNASYVTVQNLSFSNPAGAAILLVAGSDHIVIQNNSLIGSAHGLWVSSEYGPIGSGNVIMNNRISDNLGFGLAIDRDGVGATIRGNQIYNNGYDGIELTGNVYLVEGNEIYNNGTAIGGTSGIHLFVGSSTAGYCQYNTIRNNYVHDNHDSVGQDGNGITMDQWCDQNQIYGNIAAGSDGAGIALYDAASNIVQANTLHDNALDPGHTHSMRGNLVLATAGAGTNRTAGNTVQNNSIVASGAVSAIYVDALTSAQLNTLTNNPVRLQ
jgi:parallel beta-helix repeat protein